ncbi:MAG: ferrous iron transport protein B [Armatimonadota bacterium]
MPLPPTTETRASTPIIALVGNPNSGKTSIFNRLTGRHQRVANYPGVTVERVSGKVRSGDAELEIVDIPGLYSLQATTEDEVVAVQAISGSIDRAPDLLVCVMDADNLERNLFFFSQLADGPTPVVVALTMTDVAERRGRAVDVDALAAELGVDVIPVVAHKGRGVRELLDAVEANLIHARPARRRHQEFLSRRIEKLKERLARSGVDVAPSEVVEGLSDRFSELRRSVDEIPELRAALQEAAPEGDPDIAARYEWAAEVADAVLVDRTPGKRWTVADRMDYVLTHRVFGLVAFLGIMFVMFQSIYSFAAPAMDAIDGFFGWLGELVSPLLAGAPALQSLVVDGVITGIGSVMVFLPQILILFFFIAFLEGTGYLARASFLMDRLLGWCGLNGRAFVPLLSSFACAIPGIMAARVMPDAKSRLATILVAPLMSCSARLPVYILFIGAVIEPQFGPVWAGVALFGMHMVGAFVAIPIVFILNRSVFKGKRLPFVLELPPYQWPKWRDIALTMYNRGKIFVNTAGRIIFLMTIVVWALLYFPRDERAMEGYRLRYSRLPAAEREAVTEETFVQSQQIRESYMGRFGRAIEPAFAPAGFDWRLTTGVLAAFPAREVVVPALGIIFALGGEVSEESVDLRHALSRATWPDGSKLLTPWTAIGVMVFFALCCQCTSTLAVVRRETNSWKWPVFMFTYMTLLAYVFAVLIHQVGRLLG